MCFLRGRSGLNHLWPKLQCLLGEFSVLNNTDKNTCLCTLINIWCSFSTRKVKLPHYVAYKTMTGSQASCDVTKSCLYIHVLSWDLMWTQKLSSSSRWVKTTHSFCRVSLKHPSEETKSILKWTCKLVVLLLRLKTLPFQFPLSALISLVLVGGNQNGAKREWMLDLNVIRWSETQAQMNVAP